MSTVGIVSLFVSHCGSQVQMNKNVQNNRCLNPTRSRVHIDISVVTNVLPATSNTWLYCQNISNNISWVSLLWGPVQHMYATQFSSYPMGMWWKTATSRTAQHTSSANPGTMLTARPWRLVSAMDHGHHHLAPANVRFILIHKLRHCWPHLRSENLGL